MSADPRGLRADAALAATILLLGSFLFVAGFGLLGKWQVSAGLGQAPAGLGQAPDVDHLLGAAAVAGGLAIVVWWILTAVLTAAAAILVRCGKKRAAASAERFCPVFMRRLAVAVFSVQLLSAPLANAMEPPTGPAWTPTREVPVDARWSGALASGQHQETGRPATPSPRPQAAASHEAQAGEVAPPPPAVGAAWSPTPPVTDPDLLARQTLRTTKGTTAPPSEVTVLAGDTLWDIASRHLGNGASDVEIALHWPRWYEANKAQIGENPHVLLPGQLLKPPSTA